MYIFSGLRYFWMFLSFFKHPVLCYMLSCANVRRENKIKTNKYKAHARKRVDNRIKITKNPILNFTRLWFKINILVRSAAKIRKKKWRPLEFVVTQQASPSQRRWAADVSLSLDASHCLLSKTMLNSPIGIFFLGGD